MKVEKPWGYEIRWAINDKYLGKILYINKGHRLSKQYHEIKDETVYVLGPKDIELHIPTGHALRIKPKEIHRFCAGLGSDVELVEVSTPEIEDIIRIEDDYDRKES